MSRSARPHTLNLAFLAVLILAAQVSIAQIQTAGGFLERVREQEKTGLITPSQSLLLKFQYVFQPDQLPESLQPETFAPLKCGSDLVGQFLRMENRLDGNTRRQILQLLALQGNRLVYTSSGGRFALQYSTQGSDAVPAEDTDPANGVPDFIEKAAQYLEQAWTVEVLMMGFADPVPIDQPIQVQFRQMQSYGYAYIVDSELGITGLVLHNNFLGFPTNSDPEGSVLGAMKVTAAHEFKHSSQFVGSRWSEGGWIELDAVWAEDLVFDQTNDFYNYLHGGSPIRHPEVPLDGGSSETGSYEDCVWEHWLAESYGVDALVDFWDRRAAVSGEAVMETYERILIQQGSNLAAGWADFTSWNYLTSNRAVTGLGYGEAAAFPLAPVVENINYYPGSVSGQVEHLAANFIRLLGLGALGPGSLQLECSGDPGTAPLMFTLIMHLQDGTTVRETLPAGGNETIQHTASVSLDEIAWAGLVVSNPDTGGPSRGYLVWLQANQQLPVPQLDLVTPQLNLEVPAGASATAYALIGNQGQDGSVLNYEVTVWDEDPGAWMQAESPKTGGGGLKSIAGSQLNGNLAAYTPGQDLLLEVTVTNGSSDDEWLTGVELDLPAGVSLLAASSFTGGSLGDLEWSGQTGDGVVASWQGFYGSQGYGVIRDGESAVAEIQLQISPAFSGPLVLAGTISGDFFGENPHQVTSQVVLQQGQPLLAIISPEAGQDIPLGQAVQLTWQADPSLVDLEIFLSRDGGNQWESLATVPAAQGFLDWTFSGEVGWNCLIRLASAQPVAEAVSPEHFHLYPASTWLTAAVDNGQVAQGYLEPIILNCDASDLPPGPARSWLLVQHDGPGLPGIIPVTVEVAPGTSPSLPEPERTRLLGNYPNPFNPRTVIRFTLAATGRVQLDVLDLKGHRVRLLHEGELAAGEHDLAWDGRDGAGRPLAAGAYLVRLQAPGVIATQKLLLAK